MCGIAAYIGDKGAESILTVALERLTYRGYDSAGLGIVDDGELLLRRAAGRVRELERELGDRPITGRCGIAHTRWATHGAPTVTNAHPHRDDRGAVAVVHNGIIENHEALRRELERDGAVFASDTDTEVIPQLLARVPGAASDPVAAMRQVSDRLAGSYAFAAVFAAHPDRILVARAGSPLLIGRGRDATLIASDLPALLPHAERYAVVEDGWIADCRRDAVHVTAGDGTPVTPRYKPVEMAVEAVSRGDHDSFMSKEIAEQPAILAQLLADRLCGGTLATPELGIDLATINHVVFLACGTSWHAALLGKRFLEHYARVHVEVDISSEYRYRNPVASGDTLVVPISQSGETADTLAGLRLARSMFMPVVSLVNVVDSTIARESDGVLPLLAGPEIGVASTKAYTAQLLALYLFALQLARAKGRLDAAAIDAALEAARALPDQLAATLAMGEDAIEETAEVFAPAAGSVYLGRGGEHITALEGALKLKEIAYVFATGYPAGEFKHGPIALVTQHLPVLCLAPPDAMRGKMLSNIAEVRARSGRVVAVGADDDAELADVCDRVFPVATATDPLLQPVLSVLPLQRYAYHVARKRDCDVDRPRNLAKSVTVE